MHKYFTITSPIAKFQNKSFTNNLLKIRKSSKKSLFLNK